jgi:nitrate reductase NapE component
VAGVRAGMRDAPSRLSGRESQIDRFMAGDIPSRSSARRREPGRLFGARNELRVDEPYKACLTARVMRVRAHHYPEDVAGATTAKLLRADAQGLVARRQDSPPIADQHPSRSSTRPGRTIQAAVVVFLLLIACGLFGVQTVAVVFGFYVGLTTLGWLPKIYGPYRDGSRSGQFVVAPSDRPAVRIVTKSPSLQAFRIVCRAAERSPSLPRYPKLPADTGGFVPRAGVRWHKPPGAGSAG